MREAELQADRMIAIALAAKQLGITWSDAVSWQLLSAIISECSDALSPKAMAAAAVVLFEAHESVRAPGHPNEDAA